MELYIKKEQREDRDDVITIYTLDKALNEAKTEIITTEIIVRENTTLAALQSEMTAKLEAIQQLNNQINITQSEIQDIQQMIDLANNLQ